MSATIEDPQQEKDKNKFNPAHNPGDKHYADEIRTHYEKPFDPSRSVLDKPTFRDDDPGEDRLAAYRKQEQNPDNPTTRTNEDTGALEGRGDVNFKNNVQATPPGKNKPSLFARLKKKRNAFIVAVTIMGSVGGFFAFLAAPAAELVILKEQLLSKFDDRSQSRQQARVSRIVAKQLSEDPLTAGCGISPVKCRYKGMTDKQLTKFQERNPGTQIRTEGQKNIFGRNKVKSIGFTDDDGHFRYITAKDFVSAARSSSSFQKLIYNYNKSKVAMWWDKSAGDFYAKFGLSRGKRTSNKAPPSTNEEALAETKAEEDARKASVAQTRTKIESRLNKTNIIGYLCAVKGLISESKTIAKVDEVITLVKFAFGFANIGDIIKKGDATGSPGTSNLIAQDATILNKTDSNGQTAADSAGEQYARDGVLIKNKGNMRDYQMGTGADKGILGQVTRAASGVPSVPALSAVANAVLNPTVCNLTSGVVGIGAVCAGALFAAVATLGIGTAFGAVACVGGQLVVGKLVGLAVPIFLGKIVKIASTDGIVGGDAGNALVAGFSAMTSQNSKFHGSYPLTKTQTTQYDKFSDNAQGGGAYFGSAFDFSDPNSFAGRLAAAFVPPMAQVSSSLANLPTALSGLSMTSLASVSTTAQARSVIPGEYDQCDDSDYAALDIAADPFCVPQYGIDPSMTLGDNSYNQPVANIESSPRSSGFNLASLFTIPPAHAASNDNRGVTPDNRFDAEAVMTYMCGHSVDDNAPCDKWIDDHGDAIDHSDISDDYAKYITKCLETIDPVTPDSPDMCKTKDCVNASSASDTFRYCMYSQYNEDSGIDDQLEDKDASSAGSAGSAGSTPTNAPVSGTVQALAQQLLDLIKAGKVTSGHNEFGNDSADRSNPDENLQDLAAGKQANTTQLRTCTDGATNAPNKSSGVDDKLLSFLVDLGQNGFNYNINALVGQCHTATSNHYQGQAIDFGCSGFDLATADRIGQKYGITRYSGENCTNNGHWHYSTTGN